MDGQTDGLMDGLEDEWTDGFIDHSLRTSSACRPSVVFHWMRNDRSYPSPPLSSLQTQSFSVASRAPLPVTPVVAGESDFQFPMYLPGHDT